ncbi:MbcA/ParS/Xre antitoxin family protein [Vibrio sp. ZSDZ34]|uniref:MbcA/ParS/Xre antitoxin family protein n=1 Tax=Vibrio gelatinilyticus TaxID=2893468 RepID=A0A9X2AXH2_9VIBR|nr:MbcA/ParS/Xre antitoxin family protein [Vibrio gelatinilyticus]MCJ2375537.1 MbcA/ParS/Xre antitoxin family protein [Vibrio gelatinilyticus]
MKKALSSADSNIRTLAFEVFGSDSLAEEWFRRPNPSLSGRKPIDLDHDQLTQLLNSLKYGDFS